MITKYAVLNPYTGEYSYTQKRKDAISMATDIAYTEYEKLCYGNIITTIELNDDGTETWTSQSGEPVISPNEMKKQFRKKLEENSIPITKL